MLNSPIHLDSCIAASRYSSLGTIRYFRITWCHRHTQCVICHVRNTSFAQVKKKGAEKPKEYAELQAKYAKMQEMDMARYAKDNPTTILPSVIR